MNESRDYARDYFDDQRSSNAEYWRRFGGVPDVAGKRVLDIGCGHGALSVELAAHGATVVGVDLDEGRIKFATENVDERFPELRHSVDFRCVEVADLPSFEKFDVAVSKDTFEHVEDLPTLLADLAGVMRPGGLVFAGFSPLYFSPFGDHGRTGLRVPWAHAVLPRRLVLNVASRHQQDRIRSLHDLGLNGLTPRQFREAFAQSPFVVDRMDYNRGDKRLLGVLTRARRMRSLEPLATVSIYAVLRLPEEKSVTSPS